LIKIAGLVVAGVVLIAALALAFGIPAQPLVGYLIGEAEKAGFQLRVDGPSSVSLWPSLNISADDVHLARAGEAEELLSAKRVRATLSLLDVLTGNTRIREVRLSQPIVRLTTGRSSRRPSAQGESADAGRSGIGIDSLVLEDASVITRDVQENLGGTIEGLQLTAWLPAQGPVEVGAEGKAGGRTLRFTARASSASQLAAGRPTPVEAKLELPGLLKAPLSLTASLRAADRIVSIDGLRGTLGSGRVTGSVSVDIAGVRPNVNASLVLDRLEFATSESPAPARSQPWSDQPLELGVLRLFNGTVKISARELSVGGVQLAPAEIESQLHGGLLSVAISRSGLYGGPISGKLVVDADRRAPRYGATFEVSEVHALPLLTDVVGSDRLEGRMRAKVDVTAEGTSPLAIASSVAGSAEVSLEDGALRDINIVGMVRALSSQVLLGWQQQEREKTDFTSLAASFRIAKGQATTEDLRLAGPLVRVTGKGTVNFAAKTLDLRVDPRLVLSLQGQGGPPDPVGLGVPVAVRGAWAEPRIYPDIAGILDDPAAAFAKLKTMGGSLLSLIDPQPDGTRKKPDEMIKSLEQILRDKSRPSTDKARDLIRELFGR